MELQQTITGMSCTSAMRAARTAMTSAQNAGSLDTINYGAEKYGLDSVKIWISQSDGRVRDSHVQLNGVMVARKSKFPNGLMYPGDRSGAPAEVYNCRCSLGSVLPEMLEDYTGDGILATGHTVESYNEWLEEKQNASTWAEGSSYELADDDPDYIIGSDKPYEIELTDEERRSILSRGINQEDTVFAKDYDDNKFASNVKKVSPCFTDSGQKMYDVAIHGASTCVSFYGKKIDAYTFGKMIVHRKDFIRGTPIRLLSCSTGSTQDTGNCFAQILANVTGSVVYAPEDVLYVDGNGSWVVGKAGIHELKDFNPREDKWRV